MFRTSVRLQDVRRLLRSSAELELSSASVQRLKWFLYALEHECNVSLTCRHFGISRSTFLRWADRFDPTDVTTLSDASKRPKTVRKPETDARTIELIRSIRKAEPLLGKEVIAEKLRTEAGIEISSSTVGRIITRHKLFFADTKAHAEKRSSVQTPETNLGPSVVPEIPKAPSSATVTQKAVDEDDLSSFLPIVGITS